MGLPKNTLDFILNNTGKLKGKKMLELGNQRIRGNVDTPFKTGKAFFEDAGCGHTSIDMNGKDGAAKRDLSKPITGLGKFDIITNSGTSCYVKNQKQCFANIDSLCKSGGVMIHIVPEKGSNWAGIKSDKVFFECIAADYNYTIIKNETIEGTYGPLRAVVLKKKRNEKNTLDS